MSDPGTSQPEGADAGPAHGGGAEAAESAVKSRGRAWAESALILAIALVAAVLIRVFLLQAFYVPSSSMENTLQRGDRIIASKITTNLGGVSRGEVVVFRDPGGWLPEPPPPPGGMTGVIRNALTFIGLLPADTGRDLVKRVIGVGGDRIVCCDAAGHIVLNGVPLIEPYIKPGNGTAQVLFDVTVPQGTVFVMGDNRANSQDSRYHLDRDSGGVPVSNVVGRVVLIAWPVGRFGTVPIPDTFAAVPGPLQRALQ
jgi:signal peptidase I